MIFKALMKPHQNVSCLISKEIPSDSLTKLMYSTIHPSKSTLVLISSQSLFQQYTTMIIKSLSPKMMFLVKMDPSFFHWQHCCTSKSYLKASVLGWTLFPLLLLDNNCHCKSRRGNGQRGVCVCEQSRSKLSMDPQLVSREETLSLHNPPSPPKLTMALLLRLNLPMGDTASSNKPAFAARVKQLLGWLLKSNRNKHHITSPPHFQWLTRVIPHS